MSAGGSNAKTLQAGSTVSPAGVARGLLGRQGGGRGHAGARLAARAPQHIAQLQLSNHGADACQLAGISPRLLSIRVHVAASLSS